MNIIEEWLNRIICGDAFGKLQELPDDSIDLIATDPQYGWSFMGKDWDKALPRQEIYDECFRVLKPGAFMFWMSGARLDGVIENGIRIRNAGFKTDFTPIFFTYATGFPKSSNISKTIDKRACKKELTEKLGRKPTKEEFEEAWKGFRDVVGKGKGHTGEQVRNHLGVHDDDNYEWRGDYNITIPKTSQAKLLEGSYAGFQPKPAVEVIIVAMKPLSENTYVEQALKNGKGITWLDDCRIGSETRKSNVNDFTNIHSNKYGSGAKIPTTGYKEVKGRFPANLLVSDDVLNDGKVTVSKSGVRRNKNTKSILEKGFDGTPKEVYSGANDSGSFSRFFSLDAWWEEKLKERMQQPCSLCGYIEDHGNFIDDDGRAYCDECLISGDYLDEPHLRIENLPKSVQKTFPFLIVPKASKSERNKGLEGLPLGNPPGSKRSKPAPGRNAALGKPRQNFHPTVKPLKLFSYILTLASREGDLVLDPFVGSGTTAIGCKMLNRNFIGFEINQEYVTIANARLSKEKNAKPKNENY